MNSIELSAYINGSYENIDKRYTFNIVTVYNGIVQAIYAGNNYLDGKYINMESLGSEMMAIIVAMKNAYKQKADKLKIYYKTPKIGKWALGELVPDNKDVEDFRNKCLHYKKYMDIEFHITTDDYTGNVYSDLRNELNLNSEVGII